MKFARVPPPGLCTRSQIAVQMMRIRADLTKLQSIRECSPGYDHPNQELALFKTFNIGVVLGLIATAVLLHFVPAVDQVRERSIISVKANGGNSESFHVNLPIDRVLAGRVNSQNPVPPGLDWPDEEFLSGTQTELFKVRNADERVVGVASRIVGNDGREFVEWALHMPARGTMYLLLQETSSESGVRVGTMRAGTREFADLSGAVIERYVASDAATSNGVSGRLELVTSLTSPLIEIDRSEGEDL